MWFQIDAKPYDWPTVIIMLIAFIISLHVLLLICNILCGQIESETVFCLALMLC